MELDNESVKQILEIDDRIDNQTSPRYKSVGEALEGIATTASSMASGAISATLGLPTDVIAAGVGIKDAIFADEGKRMDAFSKGFTEVSKENMGSEFYKENFNQLLDSLIDNPVLKQDAKSGFSAGEFGGVGGVVANAPKIARNVIAQKETAREILSSLGLSSKAMKSMNVDNMNVDSALNLAKKLKVARAKLYGADEQGNVGNAVMAMTAKREPSPVRKMTDAEKKAQGFDFEKSFDLPMAKAKGQMDFEIQNMAKKFNGVTKNIENTGYFDDYPRGSKYISEPPSGTREEFTVVGYSVSPIRKKNLQATIDRHKKMVEYFKSEKLPPEIVKRDLPEELTFFDGDNPEFSFNKDVSDQYVYRPMLVVKDKNGKTQRLNFDMILHRDQRKDELLSKVMPKSNTPKVNILDSTKEAPPLEIGVSKYNIENADKLLKNYNIDDFKNTQNASSRSRSGLGASGDKKINAFVEEGKEVSVRLNLNSRIDPDGPKAPFNHMQTIHPVIKGKPNYKQSDSYKTAVSLEKGTFHIDQNLRRKIAEEGMKVPAMSVQGKYTTKRNVFDEMDDSVVEIGTNPKNSHLFINLKTGQAVKGFDLATVFRDRVYAKGVTYWKKIDAPKPLPAKGDVPIENQVRFKMKRGGLMARV